MKRFLSLIASMLFLVSLLPAFTAPGQQEALQKQKVYVSPEQLQVSPQGILVHYQGEWFQTNALYSDSNGIYIESQWPQERGCAEGFVPCRNCDRCVREYYDICPHCGRPV